MLRKRTAKNHARTAGHFGDLLTEYPEIGGELVTDLKNHEIAKADDARRRWYANADAISAFLSGISACWSEEKWREFFYSHLEMTEKEAALRLQGDYAADIRMCDRIETEPPRMADDMFCGLAMRSRGTHNGRHHTVSPVAYERRRMLISAQSANSGVDR